MKIFVVFILLCPLSSPIGTGALKKINFLWDTKFWCRRIFPESFQTHSFLSEKHKQQENLGTDLHWEVLPPVACSGWLTSLSLFFFIHLSICNYILGIKSGNFQPKEWQWDRADVGWASTLSYVWAKCTHSVRRWQPEGPQRAWLPRAPRQALPLG